MASTTLMLDDGATTTLEQFSDHGPTMVCVHGMAGSRLAWARVAERYGDRYRVIAYDQRGHGDSANVHGPMSLSRAIADLEQVVASVGGAQILLGHSWGGAVVVRGGRSIDALGVAAIDPMIVQCDDAWYDEYIDELAPTFALHGDARAAKLRAEAGDLHHLDLVARLHAQRTMTTEPIERLRSENRASAWDLRDDIAQYPRPLWLAMADRNDSIVPAAILDDVRVRHAPSVTIAEFDGLGHSLQREDFDRFARAFDAFLKEISSPDGK